LTPITGLCAVAGADEKSVENNNNARKKAFNMGFSKHDSLCRV
jgi:hypothetical protein